MTITATLLAIASDSGYSRLNTAVLYVMLGVAALILAFLVFFVIVCLWEKQYLAGDLEPAHEPFPYTPNVYWTATREQAARLGLRHAGDYATRKSTSLVRGLESLYFTEDKITLVSIVGAASAIAKTKKTVLRTRLANGHILESTDNPGTRDVTGGVQCAVLLNAGISELLDFHQRRIKTAGATPIPFNDAAPLAESERIQLERGQRLVSTGFARWADREQMCIRLTFRGAMAYVRDMFAHMGQLGNQTSRMDIKRAG